MWTSQIYLVKDTEEKKFEMRSCRVTDFFFFFFVNVFDFSQYALSNFSEKSRVIVRPNSYTRTRAHVCVCVGGGVGGRRAHMQSIC